MIPILLLMLAANPKPVFCTNGKEYAACIKIATRVGLRWQSVLPDLPDKSFGKHVDRPNKPKRKQGK